MSIQSVQSAASTNSAIKAAAEEARETASQTAKEAAHGDRQAQRLLAKQAAAHKKTSAERSKSPAINAQGQVTGGVVNTTA